MNKERRIYLQLFCSNIQDTREIPSLIVREDNNIYIRSDINEIMGRPF